jgi:hypothetical protein
MNLLLCTSSEGSAPAAATFARTHLPARRPAPRLPPPCPPELLLLLLWPAAASSAGSGSIFQAPGFSNLWQASIGILLWRFRSRHRRFFRSDAANFDQLFNV